MYYISLDLEWNQAYQEKALAVQRRLASRLRGEVIQIGAVKLDEKARLVGSYSITVKPKYYKKLLRHVATLTGITQERVDRGVSLPEVAESFRRFCGEDFVFLTWGPDDIPMLKDNFRIHKLDTAWLDAVYDLQPIYNKQVGGGKNQPSLESAMEHFCIPQNLPAHDALNDAYFTALVAQKLDLEAGIREYPRLRGDAYLDCEIGNADVGEDGFVEIRELLSAPEVVSPVCPLCGKPVKKSRTTHRRGQRYTAILTCETHGLMTMNLKLSQNFNDTWRAHEWIQKASDEEVALYNKPEGEKTHRPRRRTHSRRRPVSASKEAKETKEETNTAASAE